MLENRSDKAQVAVLGGMVLAGLWAWQQLPPGAMVPVRFDLQGRADGWAPAGQALLMLPGIAAASWGLGRLLVRIDPKRRNLERSAAAVSWVFLCITLLLAALQGLLVYSALGGAAPSPRWGIVLVGASLVGIGNVMGKLRHNYTVGVRTPWALADERIWERTQRFGGRSLVAGGLLLCARWAWARCRRSTTGRPSWRWCWVLRCCRWWLPGGGGAGCPPRADGEPGPGG